MNPIYPLDYNLKRHKIFSNSFVRMEKMLRNVKGFENIKIKTVEEVQRLWKNQGKIVRLHIESPTQSQNTIIGKYINPTDDGTVSSQRKIKKKY